MTSRALFCKAMREDLRHRIWMIALSCLASFMAMPVAYLLMQQEWEERVLRWMTDNTLPAIDITGRKADLISEFFVEYMSLTGGIVLFAGALIVGIFGFRYVFSKKMIDLYHSIPIKRSQLFFVHYVNGFLIWFVPMFIGALCCAILSLFFIGSFAAWTGVLGELFVTVVNLVLSFLLMYHLAIVAVMLSGNVFNTLINGTIISGAALAVYCMIEVFCTQYFRSFYSFFSEVILELLWTSPVAGSIYQMVMRCDTWNVSVVVMNIIMAFVMLAAGFVLYMRRPSELAEQGMKIKWVQILFKTIAAVLAGLVGWLLFGFLTGMDKLGWTIFGAVFGSVLAYGILDIIFNMDFKAFYKNKIQMGITTAATILIGCTFMFDWIGFDSYTPDADDIESIGIVVNSIGYGGYFSDAYDGKLTMESRMKEMKYTDKEGAHALLTKLAARAAGEELLDSPYEGRTSWCYVRVTEESGRTYYRSYRVRTSDEEVLVPILTDQSYIKTNMQIPQFLIDDISLGNEEDQNYDFRLENRVFDENIFHEEHAKAILEAYNLDMAEHPELPVYQKEEVVAQIVLRSYSPYYFNLYLDVYETMEHTIRTIQECGYDVVFEVFDTVDVERINITAYMYEKEKTLGEIFGVEDSVSAEKQPEETLPPYAGTAGNSFGPTVEVEMTQVASEKSYVGKFYDKADIRKLLEVLSLMSPHNNSIFGEDYVTCDIRIFYNDSYGEQSIYANIKKGAMPKELLEQFELETEYYY